jgi:hypothetical protein
MLNPASIHSIPALSKSFPYGARIRLPISWRDALKSNNSSTKA